MARETSPDTAVQRVSHAQYQDFAAQIRGEEEPATGVTIVVKASHMKTLRSLLVSQIEGYRATYAKRVGKNDDFTRLKVLLDQAFKAVQTEYGDFISKPLEKATFAKGRDAIQLKHPDHMWEAAQSGDLTQEAKASAHYLATTAEDVAAFFRSIQSDHPGASVAEIMDGYIDSAVQEGSLRRDLAEVRLRWSPYTTYEGEVYYAPRKRLALDDVWGEYRLLIHELLHTASHPAFNRYVESLPPSLGHTVKEGATEVLAWDLWKKIVDGLEEGTSEETVAVQSASTSKSTQLSNARLGFIRSWKDQSLHYSDQTNTVARIATALDSPNALKEAFFEGKVYELFPPADYFSNSLAVQPTHVVTFSEAPLIYDNGHRNVIFDLRSGTLLNEIPSPVPLGSQYTYVEVVSPGANEGRKGEILIKSIKKIEA